MKYRRFIAVLAAVATAMAFASCKHELEIPAGTETVNVNGVDIQMVKITGSKFMMGAQSGDSSAQNYNEDASFDEAPVKERNVYDFYIGLTEVTQELWKAVMGEDNNPSKFKGDNLPVESVSYYDVLTFINKLYDATHIIFRLPTEVEWEYAARGGINQSTNIYSGNNNLDKIAWYYDNDAALGVSNDNYGTHEVGTKDPNSLGLYDMNGNVKEWCKTYYRLYSDSLYNNQYETDGTYRILRGGAWSSQSDKCRVSCREYDYPGQAFASYGFRLAASSLMKINQ